MFIAAHTLLNTGGIQERSTKEREVSPKTFVVVRVDSEIVPSGRLVVAE
jgi:hypothetical protein